MSNYNDMQSEMNGNLSDQNKVVSLFQFIRELNKLKQKAILNFYDYPWARTVSSLPDDPDNISVFYCPHMESLLRRVRCCQTIQVPILNFWNE